MHGLSLRIGNWRFAPRLWPTLAMLFFVALTVWLGNWQSGRADAKRALQARYDAASGAAPIHVGTALLDKDSVMRLVRLRRFGVRIGLADKSANLRQVPEWAMEAPMSMVAGS